MSTLMLWLRRTAGLLLLAAGALFAMDNTHSLTLNSLVGSMELPTYLVLFATLGFGFVAGLLSVHLLQAIRFMAHRPKKKKRDTQTDDTMLDAPESQS